MFAIALIILGSLIGITAIIMTCMILRNGIAHTYTLFLWPVLILTSIICVCVGAILLIIGNFDAVMDWITSAGKLS